MTLQARVTPSKRSFLPPTVVWTKSFSSVSPAEDHLPLVLPAAAVLPLVLPTVAAARLAAATVTSLLLTPTWHCQIINWLQVVVFTGPSGPGYYRLRNKVRQGSVGTRSALYNDVNKPYAVEVTLSMKFISGRRTVACTH